MPMAGKNDGKGSWLYQRRVEHKDPCCRGWTGEPSGVLLSAENDHDSVRAVELLEKVRISGSSILADRAYSARAIPDHGAGYVIPLKSNVSEPWPVDWPLYKE